MDALHSRRDAPQAVWRGSCSSTFSCLIRGLGGSCQAPEGLPGPLVLGPLGLLNPAVRHVCSQLVPAGSPTCSAHSGGLHAVALVH